MGHRSTAGFREMTEKCALSAVSLRAGGFFVALGGELGSISRISRLSVREFLVAPNGHDAVQRPLEILTYQGLKGPDADLVSLVEGPLFDSPGLKKSCLGQNLQVSR